MRMPYFLISSSFVALVALTGCGLSMPDISLPEVRPVVDAPEPQASSCQSLRSNLSGNSVMSQKSGLATKTVHTRDGGCGQQFTIAGDFAFDVGSAQIKPQFYRALDDIAVQLSQTSGRYIVVGHTDSTGNPSANKRLSLARANAVASYLIQRGISRSRLVIRGDGQNHPIADNGSHQGRAQNRRVEIRPL